MSTIHKLKSTGERKSRQQYEREQIDCSDSRPHLRHPKQENTNPTESLSQETAPELKHTVLMQLAKKFGYSKRGEGQSEARKSRIHSKDRD